MHRELLDALSTGWIENALGVSRATVAAWRRGKFPEKRGIELTEAVLAILAGIEKEPQPEWARAMEKRLRLELRLNRALIESEVTPDEIEAMRAELHAETPDALLPDGDGQNESPRPRDGSPSRRR